MPRVHVDRHAELASFRAMLGDDPGPHILLLQAGSGMGKTSLLAEFTRLCAGLDFAHLDLKPAARYSPEEILDDLATKFGRQRFPTYQQHAREFAATASITVSDNRLEGASSLDITPGAPTREQAELRRRILTNAFFDDLAAANDAGATKVLMLDTFEAVSPEVRSWIAGHVLTRVRGYRWLVLIVAGQEIPKVEPDWEEWFLSREIGALDCDSITEYATKMGAVLDASQLAFLCTGSRGSPLLVEMLVANHLVAAGST